MQIQQPLPEMYLTLPLLELQNKITEARKILGTSAVVLTHHYQRPEVVALGDEKGDSLRLAQYASQQQNAEYIFYCGVYFMAECADILKTRQQTIILPDLQAGCDMADMADVHDVSTAWNDLENILGNDPDIIPVTYINSTAALKAFVSQKGGIICTSSNAKKIIAWAFLQKKRIFFFPDEHLGRNTCKQMGIPLQKMQLWNPELINGGIQPSDIINAQVLLWKGHCPVHMMFTSTQIDTIRAQIPDVKVIVHPECSMDVVDKADFVGSTDFIVGTIAASPAGTKWAVGTEMNLVNRIATEQSDKYIISINKFQCLCGTMNRIDLPHLLWSMDMVLQNNPQNIITVPEPIRTQAKVPLMRMLQLS